MAFTRVLGPGIHTQANIDRHNIHSTGIITATKFDGPFENFNATGILTAASANFTGNVTIGGTLTYEDVKNIDSVGLITAREGIFLPDNKKIELGNVAGSGDLQLYHDGGHSRIVDNGTGNLVVQTDGFRLRSTDQSEVLMMASKNNSVDLYYDNVKKFETSAKGIQVGTGVTIETNGQATYTGIVTATAFQLADGSAIGAGAGGTWSSYTAGIATTKSVGINTSSLDDNDLVGVGNSFQGLYISNGMMITDNSLNGNHYIGTAFNGLMAGPVNIEGTLTIDGNYVVV